MSRRPGLTRTEQLRQAKTARELQERAARLPPPEPLKVRKRHVRPPRRPPRAPPAVTPRPPAVTPRPPSPVAGPSVPRVPSPPRRPVTPKKPIPPGAVSEERTTIISVAQPPVEETQISEAASRSIQVISETLNEQDAAESAAVQSKLADLQQARRDFVIAAANVGASAFALEDITPPELFDVTPPPSIAAPEIVAPRRYVRVPELHEEFLQPEYGMDHPDIIAAREHMRKVKAEIQAREAALEEDIAWEEREGIRIKAHIPPPPKIPETYQYEPFDPEQLERFFDIETYPPCEPCGPPPGREHLPPDLWELEDPWYKPLD